MDVFECESCGARWYRETRRCYSCRTDGVADAEEVTSLLAARAKVGPDASWVDQVIRTLTDSRAVSSLTSAFEASDRRDVALVEGLASIASDDSFELMREVVLDPEAIDSVRREALRYCARLASPEAHELLLRLALDDGNLDATIALGHLGDYKISTVLVEKLLTMEDPPFASPYPQPARWTVANALIALADPATIPVLLERLDHLSDMEARIDELVPDGGERWRRAKLERIDRALSERANSQMPSLEARRDAVLRDQGEGARSEARREITSRLTEVRRVLTAIADESVGVHADSVLASVTGHPHEQRSEPQPVEGSATEPIWLLELMEDESLGPVTRFGGQPSWLSKPTWPIAPDGRPMAFWGQFAIPWQPDSLVYLFVDTTPGELCMSEDGTAALFVQPGGVPTVPWSDRAEGPLVPVWDFPADDGFNPPVHRRIVSRTASLRPKLQTPSSARDLHTAVPDAWWNKVGGGPIWLQGDETPGSQWRFLFQFGAEHVGHELGDAAECYGFVREDGRGTFLWQCH